MALCYRGEADLNICPRAINHPHSHVSIGDIHGNALKLIYTLIEEGVLHLSPNQYGALRDIYYKSTDKLTSEDLAKFRQIITEARINKKRAITLIGDELADRGQNDYFTLLVLKKLHNENTDINIMLSNHSVEFIRDYEKEQFTGQYKLLAGQGASLKGMHTLIKKI